MFIALENFFLFSLRKIVLTNIYLLPVINKFDCLYLCVCVSQCGHQISLTTALNRVSMSYHSTLYILHCFLFVAKTDMLIDLRSIIFL